MTPDDTETLVVDRPRDAFATIRGFKYQIALTVDRWLTLKPGTKLQLEKGEDIDICRLASGLDGEPVHQRVLEQVKRLEGSITLRTPGVVGFLANAREHIDLNPGSALVFRFVTTARPGIERPSGLRPRSPAIDAWAKIANGLAPTTEQPQWEAAIREILRSSTQPEKLSDTTWQRYGSFLADADDAEFRQFLGLVEWEVLHADEVSVQHRIERALLARDAHATPDEARAIFKSLFMYVLELVSRPGQKILTAVALEEQIQRADAGRAAAYDRIEQALSELVVRVTSIEESVADHQAKLSVLVGAGPSVELQERPLHLLRPLKEGLILPRDDLVRPVRESLQEKLVALLLGDIGCGKSQVAALAVEGLPLAGWLRAYRYPEGDLSQTLRAAGQEIGSGGILVIDGLPRVDERGPLMEDLISLINAGVRLLVTSSHDLPGALQITLGASSAVHSIPPLTKEQTCELLRLHGAPPDLLARFGDAAQALTRGYPGLVRMLAQYLQRRTWALDEQTVRAVFVGEYAGPLRDSAQRFLIEAVQDATTRELLYRLDIVIGPAGAAEIDAVAAVSPAIGSHREKMIDLKGPWLRQSEPERFEVTPILRGIGLRMLEPEVTKATFRSLADLTVSKRPMDVIDLSLGLHYMMMGGDQDGAAQLYLGAAWAYLRKARGHVLPDALSSWIGKIPAGVSRGLRLTLSGVQVRLLEGDPPRATNAADELLRELQTLRGDEDPLTLHGALYAALISGPVSMERNGLQSVRLARQALACLKFVQRAEPEIASSVDQSVGAALWLSAARVESVQALEEWTDLLDEAPPELLARTGNMQALADGISYHAPRSVVFGEMADTRRVNVVDDRLARLQRLAASRGLAQLEGGACAARVILKGRFARDIVAAERLRSELSGAAKDDPTVEFMLREALGNEYLDRGLRHEAARELVGAAAIPIEFAPFSRVRVALNASACVRDTDRSGSVELARLAVDLAADPKLPFSERVKAICELGIAVGDIDGPAKALRHWSEAASILLSEPESSPADKGLFMVAGHAVGYYAGLARGQAPDQTLSGDEYARPLPRMFLQDMSRAAVLYDDRKRAMLPVLMEVYAEASRDSAEQDKWGRLAMQLLETADIETRAMAANSALPFQVANDGYSVAIQNALAAGDLARQRRGAGAEFPRGYALFTALVPAFARVATLVQAGAPTAKAATSELLNTAGALEEGSPGWSLAKRIVEVALLRYPATVDEMEPLFAEAEASGDSALRIVVRLARSMCEDLDFEEMLQDQLDAFEGNGLQRRSSLSEVRLIDLPFAIAHWRRVFDRAGFRFVAPWEYARALTAAETGKSGLRSLLEATASALGRPASFERLRDET